MSRATATLIYNPLAGPADIGPTLTRVAQFWERRGWEIEIQATQYAGHAVVLAREAAAAGRRLVLAAGGDGTLGEVANGLAGSESVLGPLPTGTGNSFGKELRMPRPNLIDHRGLVEAAATLSSGRVHQMDLGRFESGKYWMLWTGAGVDSYVVSALEPRSKLSKRLGPLGYVASAVTLVPHYRPMEATITVDGYQFSDRYLLVVISNCRRYAGGEVLLNPEAQLDDGLFELFLFRGDDPLKAFNFLWHVWRGTHHNHPDVEIVQCRQVTLETVDSRAVQTDGDPGASTPFTCTVAPGALRLLVPGSAPARLFNRPGEPLL